MIMQKEGRIMKKIYIFGAGANGKQLLEELTKWGQRKRVVAFIDNDKEKQMFGVGGWNASA